MVLKNKNLASRLANLSSQDIFAACAVIAVMLVASVIGYRLGLTIGQISFG